MEPEQAIHRWITALDIEGYSRRDNPAQSSLHDALYELAAGAVADAGLTWREFETVDVGDSVFMFAPSGTPPVRLAGPFVRALDDRLAERARRSSAAYTLRVRVALHGGIVSRDRHGWSGDAVNLTARYLDSRPLREILAAATRANLAFIVSDEVYQSVIRHEYRSIETAAYGRVSFDVKQLTGVAGWVYVPGYATPPGAAEPAATGPAADPAVGVVMWAGAVNGDMVNVKNVYGSGRG